jgi:mycofactocin glycosyltransferase
VLRLSVAGAALVDRLAEGEPVPPGASGQVHGLIRRLLDGGLAHPCPPGDRDPELRQVAVVVPVRDRREGLERTLAALEPVGQVIVVDDGSSSPVPPEAGREVIRHPVPRGPAAARNSGWRATTLPVVAFVDADIEPAPGWLARLVPHLGDPSVAAVAPRVTSSRAGRSDVLARYEAYSSPLDLGPAPAPVRPGAAIAYVPSAALVARREALLALGGFDESLRVGEDVDLVWRLYETGWRVRYEPSSRVAHPPRPGIVAFARQRVAYGSSAGPLGLRHPRAISPLPISAWALSAWTSAALGWPAPAAGLAAGSAALLARRLRSLPHPWPEVVRLTGKAHLQGGRALARALVRDWWPLSLPAALVSRRARRAVLLAATIPPLVEWAARRSELDPLRWLAFRTADNLCYGAGLWAGSWQSATVRPLLPRLLKWPGQGHQPG